MPTLFSPAHLAACLSVGLLACAAPALAQTSPPASLYVVHGIPGRDVAPTLDPLLPVDVLVDGKVCLLHGLAYRDIAGPFVVPAGTYTVAVSLANTLAPCTGTVVITASATLGSGESGAVVAAISTSGKPTAEVYGIDTSPVGAGLQRFVVAHAASAPAVKVTATSAGGGAVETASFNLAPGTENTVNVPARTAFTLSAAVGRVTIGPALARPGNKGVTAVFAVGSGGTGSAILLTKLLPSVE